MHRNPNLEESKSKDEQLAEVEEKVLQIPQLKTQLQQLTVSLLYRERDGGMEGGRERGGKGGWEG